MMDRILDKFMEYVLMPVGMLLLAASIVMIPVVAYECYTDAKKPTFELKKEDWECGRYHEYTTTTYILVGKVLVPSTTVHKDCIQWNYK